MEKGWRNPDARRHTADAGVGVRTFLIVDFRGYTRFTQAHGDEAAGQLVARFAALAREVVIAAGGELIELRGDEALCAFSSARQALRAAVELQIRFRQRIDGEPVFPLGIGIGLAAGEAVPVEGGYRGGALNLAARLCSVAGPGEIFASETVTSLAGRLEGARFMERRGMRLKGLDRPVRALAVVPEVALPPVPEAPAARGRTRRTALGAAGAVVLLAAAVAAAVAVGAIPVLRPDDEPSLRLAPNTVGLVDPERGAVVRRMPVGTGPTAIAFGAGSAWIANHRNETVTRVPARGGEAVTIPLVGHPTGVAFVGDKAWVPTLEGRLVQIDPRFDRARAIADVRRRLGAIVAAGDWLWISAPPTTIVRIPAARPTAVQTLRMDYGAAGPLALSPERLWVFAPGLIYALSTRSNIPGPPVSVPTPFAAVATGLGSVWVAGTTDEGGVLVRVDEQLGVVESMIPVGNAPSAVAVGDRSVWVASRNDAILERIDPAENEVVQTIELGAPPTALAAAGDGIWVAAE